MELEKKGMGKLLIFEYDIVPADIYMKPHPDGLKENYYFLAGYTSQHYSAKYNDNSLLTNNDKDILNQLCPWREAMNMTMPMQASLESLIIAQPTHGDMSSSTETSLESSQRFKCYIKSNKKYHINICAITKFNSNFRAKYKSKRRDVG